MEEIHTRLSGPIIDTDDDAIGLAHLDATDRLMSGWFDEWAHRALAALDVPLAKRASVSLPTRAVRGRSACGVGSTSTSSFV